MFFHHSRQKDLGRRCRDRKTDKRLGVKSGTGRGCLYGDGEVFANFQVCAVVKYLNLITWDKAQNVPSGFLPSKKPEPALGSLANCTFLWLLLVARRGPTFSQKASSHLPHASHLLANGRSGRLPPPFALRGVHPSLSRDGSRRKWYLHIFVWQNGFLNLILKNARQSPMRRCSLTRSLGKGSVVRLTSGQRSN